MPTRPDPISAVPHREQALFTAQNVKIVGIQIPFWQLAELIFRLMLAAIPAAIGFALLWALVWGFLFGTVLGVHR